MYWSVILISFYLANPTLGLYSSSDDVKILTPEKLDKLNGIAIVEFYADWCGHCKQFAPEYKKLATYLKKIVTVGALDSDKYKNDIGKYGIRGYPTIKFMADGKLIDYNGQRTASAIVEELFKQMRALVDKRMGHKSKKSDKNHVIELTDDNYSTMVMKDTANAWLVEFFAPWCGHCKQLAPEWASAASTLKDTPGIKLGALDATVHTSTAAKYQIQGYPTIKYIDPNTKEVIDYDGGRSASAIVDWVKNKLLDNVKDPEILQITKQSVLKEACDENTLCIISFLPHILDCQSECRNNYLEMLKKIGAENKKHKIGWLWCEAGQQPDLEKALDIGGFGYPAMVAVSSKKKVYTILRGAFSDSGIREFIRDIVFAKAIRPSSLNESEFQKVKTVKGWDGKDGKLEDEEPVVIGHNEL